LSCLAYHRATLKRISFWVVSGLANHECVNRRNRALAPPRSNIKPAVTAARAPEPSGRSGNAATRGYGNQDWPRRRHARRWAVDRLSRESVTAARTATMDGRLWPSLFFWNDRRSMSGHDCICGRRIAAPTGGYTNARRHRKKLPSQSGPRLGRGFASKIRDGGF
jgi:hypothetical protein